MTVTAAWSNPGPGGALDLAAGALVTEAVWDAQISNWYYQFGATGNGPWTIWTPTLTQSGSVAITINYASYAKIGKIALVQLSLACTGAGTAGQVLTIGALPSGVIPPLRTGSYVLQGGGLFIDASASNAAYVLSAVCPTSTQITFYSAAGTGGFGANPSIAAASGDSLSAFIMFEVS